MSATLSLADLRCGCGSTTIMSVKPGADAVYAEARDLFGALDKRMKPIMVAAPVPDQAFCLPCLLKRKP